VLPPLVRGSSMCECLIFGNYVYLLIQPSVAPPPLQPPYRKNVRSKGPIRASVTRQMRPLFTEMLTLYAEVRPILGLPVFGDYLFADEAPAAVAPTRGQREDWRRADNSPGGQLVTDAFARVQQLAGNTSPQHVCVNGLRHTYATNYISDMLERGVSSEDAQAQISLLADAMRTSQVNL